MVVFLVPVAAPAAAKAIIGGLCALVSAFTISYLAFGFTSKPKYNQVKSDQFYGIRPGTYSNWQSIPILSNQIYHGLWTIRKPEYLINIQGRCDYNGALKGVYCLRASTIKFKFTKSQYQSRKLACEGPKCEFPTNFKAVPSQPHRYIDKNFILATLGFETNFDTKDIEFIFTVNSPGQLLAWYQVLLLEVAGTLYRQGGIGEIPRQDGGIKFNLSIPLVYQDNYVGFYGLERV